MDCLQLTRAWSGFTEQAEFLQTQGSIYQHPSVSRPDLQHSSLALLKTEIPLAPWMLEVTADEVFKPQTF